MPSLARSADDGSLGRTGSRGGGSTLCGGSIGTSNFFELAVAAAISLFGFKSVAALATVVGVLIEVPVMLSVVKIVNNTKNWYERGRAVQRSAHAITTAAARTAR